MATASGRETILYSTTSTGICSVTGSTLSLIKAGKCSVTATAKETNLLMPISATVDITVTGTAMDKTTIKCRKGKITKKISGVNVQCPSGYKKVQT
jgi:hypothetical protein